MYWLLVLNLIIPFVMIIVGDILKKHPVENMKSNNGYNYTYFAKIKSTLGICTEYSTWYIYKSWKNISNSRNFFKHIFNFI